MRYDPTLDTAFFIGRFQPFHEGHRHIVEKLLLENSNILIGVINRPKDNKNPLNYKEVIGIINKKLKKYKGRYKLIKIGNIKSFNYGRKVGYKVKKVRVPKSIEEISSTKIRKKLNLIP